jgi:hypothetical protein
MNTIQIDRLTQTNELATELASESARASASKSANEATARTSQNSLHKTPQNSSPKKLYPVGSSTVNPKICCCYVNNTAQFQIIRLATTLSDPSSGLPSSGLIERTVLPYTSLLFEASSHDYLEVHTGNLMSAIHSDTIPCRQLAYRGHGS